MVDFENPKLRCESGAVIELNSNPFSIGRGLSCNYVITRKAVSRVHCIMEKNDNTWILKDTSTNGSFVNGKLIKGVKSPPLKEGDLIKLDLDGEYYIFEMETGNRADDISDEQLCSFADTVLSEVEAFQQETHNQENNDPFINESTQVNVNSTKDNVPVTVSAALQDHFGMVKSVASHLSKKQKTEVGTSVAAITAHTSLVDLTHSSSDSSVNPVNKSPEKPEPSMTTDKEPPDVTSTSDVATSGNPIQPAQTTTDQQENYEVMENELQCAICSELFIKAVTLTCSHTFCKYCIELWKKNKSVCPICRAKITGMTATLVLDNVIEKVIEASPEDIQQRRKQVLEERKKQEEAKPPQKQNNSGRGNGRRGRGGRGRTTPVPVNMGTLYGPVIEVSSDSDNDLSSSDNSEDTNEWRDEYDNDDWYDEGVPGTYYGGYGHCFSCGRRGHWSNGCPYR